LEYGDAVDITRSGTGVSFAIGAPGLILRVGLTLAVLLASASFLTQIPLADLPSSRAVQHTLNVDSEASIATWASTGGLLLAALMTYSIASSPGQEAWRKQWLLLAGTFAFLSMDEALSFHEGTIGPVRSALETGGIFYYAWVIPYGIAVGILALALRRFVWALEPSVRSIVLLAACLYLGGALGMELVGGAIADSTGQASTALVSATTVEELLEMSGITVFLYGLARLQAMSPAVASSGS
jgi:hypothetical protein